MRCGILTPAIDERAQETWYIGTGETDSPKALGGCGPGGEPWRPGGCESGGEPSMSAIAGELPASCDLNLAASSSIIAARLCFFAMAHLSAAWPSKFGWLIIVASASMSSASITAIASRSVLESLAMGLAYLVDGMFDRMFDGMLNGMLDQMLDGMFDGVLDETLDKTPPRSLRSREDPI